jgi:hypothetical protein
MKRFLTIGIIVIIVAFIAYFLFIYYVPYSEGYRAGELVKISKKGLVFKTWEGRLSQGVSESQHFEFSVEGGETLVLEQLKDLQGQHVKLTYIERFGTFPWMGDTNHFITAVEKTDLKE